MGKTSDETGEPKRETADSGSSASAPDPGVSDHPVQSVDASAERERITRVYGEYARSTRKRAAWSSQSPGAAAMLRSFHDEVRKSLYQSTAGDFAARNVLEIGCGPGGNFDLFLRLGIPASNLYGVDLLEARVEQAKARHPDVQLICCDARQLPFADGAFDFVLASVVFSSILDDRIAAAVASEMVRVLKSGGAVIWYDVRFRNPWNRNVRPYSPERISALFPDFDVKLRTTSVLPPLARALPGHFVNLYDPLSRIPFLRSHLVGLLTKSVRLHAAQTDQRS